MDDMRSEWPHTCFSETAGTAWSTPATNEAGEWTCGTPEPLSATAKVWGHKFKSTHKRHSMCVDSRPRCFIIPETKLLQFFGGVLCVRWGQMLSHHTCQQVLSETAEAIDQSRGQQAAGIDKSGCKMLRLHTLSEIACHDASVATYSKMFCVVEQIQSHAYIGTQINKRRRQILKKWRKNNVVWAQHMTFFLPLCRFSGWSLGGSGKSLSSDKNRK